MSDIAAGPNAWQSATNPQRLTALTAPTTVDFFADNVAFDNLAWRKGA